MDAASGGRPGILMRQAEADGYGRRRHRCGDACATGAGRTDPAAGNGTEYRCTPAQGARRGPKAVPGQFSSGTHQYKTAALPAPEYFPLHHTFSCPGTGSPEPTRYRPRGGMRPHNSKTAHIEYILKLRYDELLHFFIFCQTKGQGICSRLSRKNNFLLMFSI